jgi:hypothetical protein
LMDRHGVRMRIPTVLCIFSLYWNVHNHYS